VTDLSLSAQPGAKMRARAVVKREGLSLNLECKVFFNLFFLSLSDNMAGSERMEIMKPSSIEPANKHLSSMTWP